MCLTNFRNEFKLENLIIRSYDMKRIYRFPYVNEKVKHQIQINR